MMWYWGTGVHWWMWLLGFVGMVAFWGLIVWAIWSVVTSGNGQPEHGQNHGQAQRILDERVARGEIDADEYRRLRDVITTGGQHAHSGRIPVSSGDRR
jgi:putative membrane protein